MKRIIALFLTLAMLSSLAACGGGAAQGSGAADAVQGEAADASAGGGADGADGAAAEESKEEISFSEVVAVDNDECAITITGIEPDNMWGYTLKALLENKSADKTYMFSVASAAINGVQCDPFFAQEVAAGKKSNNDISFADSTLAENGVGDFTDIELTFSVYDSNDRSADKVANETVHIYPYGEDKAVPFVREPKDTDTVLFDNDAVAAIVTGYEVDDIWGYTVDLYLLNKTDTEVMFSVDEASVNGFMADPFFARAVSAGKCTFCSLSWSDTTLEENGISDVEEIQFDLRAYDNANWTGDDLANENIVLNP